MDEFSFYINCYDFYDSFTLIDHDDYRFAIDTTDYFCSWARCMIVIP